MFASILTKWSFDPTVFGGLAMACAVYWHYTHGPKGMVDRGKARHDGRFAGAILLALLVLESPLDFVADHYLFSAHMVQHLVLILGVAPLLALSVPDGLIEDLKQSRLAWLGRWCIQPVVVFAAFVLDVWLWHAPPLYEATLRSESVHAAEHLSFVGISAAFWWVAFAPNGNARQLPMLARLGYVFLAAVPNTILGALLAFAPNVLYPSYQRALEQPGFGRALQLEWGVTALADQQLGGLIMWVPGGIVYLVVIVGILMSWFVRQQPSQAGAA